MKSLALVTPWPPQHSGIADYAYDLVTALHSGDIDIVVYTTEENPRPLQNITIISVNEHDTLEELTDYDCIVYQLGNNTSFHLWMIPLLEQYPGVIHVHDLVMHHVAAWLTWQAGDKNAYLNMLEKWYGLRGLSHGLRMDSGNYLWKSVNVMEFPLYEEYVQHAQAVVVHSAYALTQVRHSLPHIPSFQMPQLYNIQPCERPRSSLRKIAIMGGVDPQKHLDWVLEAVSVFTDHELITPQIELHIAGSLDERCEHLQEQARNLCGPNLTAIFHGRVSEQQFIDLFTQADLCIALRYPTMGETSAIVMRALQLGIPTIVNNIGWYAELPGEIVRKLPVHDCASILGSMLIDLISNEDRFQAWANSCQTFAIEEFSLEEYGTQYKKICGNPLAVELITDIHVSALADCGLTGEDDEDILLQQILHESRI